MESKDGKWYIPKLCKEDFLSGESMAFSILIPFLFWEDRRGKYERKKKKKDFYLMQYPWKVQKEGTIPYRV